jgi:anaerobic magnesium-protoporphyrin IX monomethyl ester cyclase
MQARTEKETKLESTNRMDATGYLGQLICKAFKLLFTSPRGLTSDRIGRGWRRFNALRKQKRTESTSVKSKCDLMLIQAPGWGMTTPPLALAMLTAYARQKGYRVLPIDLNCQFYMRRGRNYEDTWELSQSLCFWNTPFKVEQLLNYQAETVDRLMDLIAHSKPAAVGFTIYSSSVHVSLHVAKKIRALDSTIKIIFGGPHASRFMYGKALAAENCVDVVAQGEGEWILGEFLRRLQKGEDIHSIPGTLVKKNGNVIDNGDSELVRNLDELPFVDFSDYDFNNYREPYRLPIMSSRGCVNRCIFCNERPYWKTYRSLTAKRIFSEVKYQLDKHPSITWLDFQDSVVNGNIRELEKFADLIIENDVRIQWSGQAVVRKEMTPELLRKFKASGCVCLAYGMETPSPSLMLKVGKVISKNTDIDKMVKDCAEAGLTCAYNFMFGLPGETEDDAVCTLEFIKRNKNYLATVNPSPSFCGFSPGSLGYENPKDYGLDVANGALYWEGNNGANNYIVRLERFERFCQLVQELGIPTTYPNAKLLDRDRTIGHYYLAVKKYDKAAESFKRWLDMNPEDEEIKKCYSHSLEEATRSTTEVQGVPHS